MKMRNHILRTVSVFFLVLMLVGCGIAVIFYIDSYIDVTDNDTETTLSGSYVVRNDEFNNLALIEDDTGPSLWIGYLISDSKTIPHTSIISKFADTYGRKPSGRTIDRISQSNPSVLTLNDASYSLFQFSDTNSANDNAAPFYHATALNPNSPEDTFVITKSIIDTQNIEFLLSFTESKFGSHVDGGVLRRFDGSRFRNNVTYSESLSNNNLIDYKISSTPSGHLYCHIFAAMNVTEGEFSNIYWTNLAYLGHLQLD